MENIGVVLNPDQLVLTRGRDFRWVFEHLEGTPPAPTAFPAGQLYLELQTRGETNALQEVTVEQATGGTYKLSHGGQWTAPIDFNDVTTNPHNLSGDITDALEAVPTIGAGNVKVLPSSLVPVWEVALTLNAGHVLTEQMVNTLNVTLTDLYNTFAGLLGVTVDFTIQDNLNLTVKVTSNRSFDEVGLITFAIDVTSSVIADALNAVSAFLGVFNVLHVNFYWIHKYTVEFTGDLGLQPQPKLGVDASLLTGIDTPSVTVDVLDPGRAPVTKWYFDLEDTLAHIKIESETADQIANRTEWQLVWLPDGEVAGGDPVAEGFVKVQMQKAYVKEAS